MRVAAPKRRREAEGSATQGKTKKEKFLSRKDEADEYLRKVQQRFKDKTSVFKTFLGIMKKFRDTKIDTGMVVDRVKSLFRDHEDLLLGFNVFCPQEYQIKVEGKAREQVPKENQPIDLDRASTYVNKIRERFAHDERAFEAFLAILDMHRKGKKDTYRVYEDVSVLFGDHPDLLKEFASFLPCSLQPSSHLHSAGMTRERESFFVKEEYAKGDDDSGNYQKNFLMFLAVARGGFRDVLDWLKSQGCDLGKDACEAAAEGGHHTMVLRWLRKECPWNLEKCISAAAQNQNVDMSEWIQSFLPSANK